MKKRITFLAVILLITISTIRAQSIFIYLSDNSTNEYPLSQISKITYSNNEMLLHKIDTTTITFALTNVVKYSYSLSSNIEKNNTHNAEIDLLVYPNPSKGNFNLEYKIAKDDNINISLLSIDGRLIETILFEIKNKGSYSIVWKNNKLAFGSYFIKLQNRNEVTIQKIIIL